MRLIIGYGNTLRCDDGVGCYAAQMIAEQGEFEGVMVLQRQQLTVELVELISRASQVIFIDACVGEPAGTIRVAPVKPSESDAIFTHTVTPAALLTGSLLLYGTAPQATLFTVCADSFAFAERLSQPVARVLPELVARVIAEITPFI